MHKIQSILVVAIVCLIAPKLFAQNLPLPAYEYLNNFDFEDTSLVMLSGPARIIEQDGRKGLNMTSIHSVLQMKAHTLKSNEGTVSMWVMSLEDMSPYRFRQGMEIDNPFYRDYPLLSDNPNHRDVNQANFKFVWTSGWHPSLRVQYTKGNFYDDNFRYPHAAFISVSHFTLQNRKWYQFTLSWNHQQQRYALYANGILIGREDQFREIKFRRDSINSSLFLGNPTLCMSDIRFYQQEMSEKEVYNSFRNQVTLFDQETEKMLLFTFTGKGHKSFQFTPGKEWVSKLDLSLKKPSHLDSFYVQGNPIEVKITDEGLLFETVDKQYTGGELKKMQAYLWTHSFFEGDLYVEYEFKVLRPGGLSLLMLQASGVNREDFMKDYPLKTTGEMITVYGENVRNYHWEYYREMSDMNNDRQNSVLVKNPFSYPLAFSAYEKPVDYTLWNKLQFLQVEDRLVGAINGIVMFDVKDNSFINN